MMDDSSSNERRSRMLSTGRQIRLAVIVSFVIMALALLIVTLGRHGPVHRGAVAADVADSARIITMQCNLFAADFEGHYPPHLAPLVLRGMNPKVLVAGDSGTVPMKSPPEIPLEKWSTIAAEVDGHCDFIYVGAGIRAGDPPTIIVLCTKPGVVAGGRVIGFVDGHAEFVAERDFNAALDANNRAREEAKRPSIMPR